MAAASPLAFTLRVAGDSATEEEVHQQQQQLVAAFELALPGGAERREVGQGCCCCCCCCCCCARHPSCSHHAPTLTPTSHSRLRTLPAPCCYAEGSAAELTAAEPAAEGSLLLTVSASLPRHSSGAAEELQYLAAVLQTDAAQVFTPSVFGEVSLVSVAPAASGAASVSKAQRQVAGDEVAGLDGMEGPVCEAEAGPVEEAVPAGGRMEEFTVQERAARPQLAVAAVAVAAAAAGAAVLATTKAGEQPEVAAEEDMPQAEEEQAEAEPEAEAPIQLELR